MRPLIAYSNSVNEFPNDWFYKKKTHKKAMFRCNSKFDVFIL